MTTNQPTQPDMFEPPEKFGNYLADKCLAAFNQPTDATPQAGELYPCKDWPSCDHQRCEDASYLQQIQAHHAEVDELTTQLATAQALAGGA